jgi:hypothetical protein
MDAEINNVMYMELYSGAKMMDDEYEYCEINTLRFHCTTTWMMNYIVICFKWIVGFNINMKLDLVVMFCCYLLLGCFRGYQPEHVQAGIYLLFYTENNHTSKAKMVTNLSEH